MNAKKKRKKNQRRARKLADQAWEAADDDNLDLALKLVRRAVDQNPGNPVLWNDQGLLFSRCGRDEQAAASFEAAITLAADFAEPYAHLGAIRMRQGKTERAVALLRQAVQHAPESSQYRKTLTAFESLMGRVAPSDASSSATQTAPEPRVTDEQIRSEHPSLAARINGLRWPTIEEQLSRTGCVHLRELLSPEECDMIRTLLDDESLFSKSVTMAKSRFGRGVYRYFMPPIPTQVDAIRRLVYPHLARIANQWQGWLAEVGRYPLDWERFRQRCAEAGQCAPSPIMLRYETGGFNAFHQDIRGEIFFPFQLLVVLSPRLESPAVSDDGFCGGEFLFTDVPQRRTSDCRRVTAGLGDAVIFATRDRLAQVGGAYGLKPVKHGMAKVSSGTRYALGLPFHEYE